MTETTPTELQRVSRALVFDNTYARLPEGFFASWQADRASAPELLRLNAELAAELGLDLSSLSRQTLADLFAGNLLPESAEPLAQAYAGHQFGGFSPQLGDGRALLLGELVDPRGRRWDLQLKGSGATPFSRGGDGKSALGPVLREYLVAEAMSALGVPTTRALAAVTTGDLVVREGELPGGVLTRVAASHVRVGTFQYFAARGETERVRQLADYVIDRHDPDLRDADSPYLELLGRVVERQADLVARWMLLGFVHGVMNTDNMTVSGETIDYGPCAFMERYDPATVFSSIDHGGRYAYGNQPQMALWNLARFAETLVPLIDDDQERAIARATEVLDAFRSRHSDAWLLGARRKLGLQTAHDDDLELVADFLQLLHQARADTTASFRALADVAAGRRASFLRFGQVETPVGAWLDRWRSRLAREDATAEQRVNALRAANPVYIPRNHKVEEALDAAVTSRDLGPFDELLELTTAPYEERDGRDDFAAPAPIDAPRYRTFCGT